MRKRIRDIENEQYQKIKNKTHRKMEQYEKIKNKIWGVRNGQYQKIKNKI